MPLSHVLQVQVGRVSDATTEQVHCVFKISVEDCSPLLCLQATLLVMPDENQFATFVAA